MVGFRRLGSLVGIVAALFFGGQARCHAQTEVDLALVIAVDISYSMDADEQDLQKQGFAEAFRSPEVHEAIRKGLNGRIAVTYMEWAGANDQRVLIPWTVLDGPETILHFADQIASLPLRRAARTSISGALGMASRLFGTSNLKAGRRVIDVSGDGANNEGRAVTQARDEIVAQGMTINGLPIMLKEDGFYDTPNLDHYYRDCVIGGRCVHGACTGAFAIPTGD